MGLTAVKPEELAGLLVGLRRAQLRLAARPSESILASLAVLVERWLQPGSVWRRRAETMLPAATGFSAEMIRYALPLMLEPLRAPAVAELLDAELGGRRLLDTQGGDSPARGPNLVVHILPSNLPALAAVPVVLTLAIKAATLVKAGRGDRVFPLLLAGSIAEIDAELGACVAACYWPGGDRACEDGVFTAADLIVASGNDASVEDARARRGGRFIGYGHRVSFAVVAREVLADSAAAQTAAQALALDVALWDQRGCLSPQVCFVEGDFDSACRFGAILAPALEDMARRLPPGAATTAELVAVRRFCEEAEWRRFGGKGGAVFRSAEGWAHGTIVVDPEPVFRPTALCRSLRILPLRSSADLPALLAPVRSVVEGAGIATEPQRSSEWMSLLTAAGAHRVCRLGSMQRPPLSWCQGGRPRVAEWMDRSADAT